MTTFIAIFKRELLNYFITPIAYVFIIMFLLLANLFTFYLGDFFARNQVDLTAFFTFHPWLYLLLMPAIAMRLWAEERKTGTIELLLTLPVNLFTIVFAKFCAAWLLAALALTLTLPLWLTVNYLGHPDNGVILAGYLGSWLMSGGFLAISLLFSACSKNQVIAFILGSITCLIFILCGFPIILDFLAHFLPTSLLEIIRTFSFLSHFETVSRGLLDIRDIIFFIILISFCLFANVLIIEHTKAD